MLVLCKYVWIIIRTPTACVADMTAKTVCFEDVDGHQMAHRRPRWTVPTARRGRVQIQSVGLSVSTDNQLCWMSLRAIGGPYLVADTPLLVASVKFDAKNCA